MMTGFLTTTAGKHEGGLKGHAVQWVHAECCGLGGPRAEDALACGVTRYVNHRVILVFLALITGTLGMILH